MIMPVEYTKLPQPSSAGITQSTRKSTLIAEHISHTTPLTGHISTVLKLLRQAESGRFRRPREGKALLEELVISTDSVSQLKKNYKSL